MRWSRFLPFVLSAIVALVLLQVDARVLAQGKGKKTQPQQSDDKGKAKSDDTAKKEDEQPRNIMGGKSLGLKSSRQEKDSATMGFNGLDPQGKVEKAMLSAYATSYDIVDAKSLVAYKPVPKELAEFVQQGQLKNAPPPAAAADNKSDKKKDKKK
jgi:hypothetical protein